MCTSLDKRIRIEDPSTGFHTHPLIAHLIQPQYGPPRSSTAKAQSAARTLPNTQTTHRNHPHAPKQANTSTTTHIGPTLLARHHKKLTAPTPHHARTHARTLRRPHTLNLISAQRIPQCVRPAAPRETQASKSYSRRKVGPQR